MTQKIANLTIERFRALRRLKIEGLGRINLITGRNNSGKSSVLEALRILAADGSAAVIYEILRAREEDVSDSDDTSRPVEWDGPFQMAGLFYGFPRLSDDVAPIVIESSGGTSALRLGIRIGWYSDTRDPQEGRRLVPVEGKLFEDPDAIPMLVMESRGEDHKLPLNFASVSRRVPLRGRPLRFGYSEEPRLACMYVSPYGGERTGSLGTLWDKIALSEEEQEVVGALQIIDPSITAVSMVGGEGPSARPSRTAIVRSSRFPRPVPLRSYGDGLNRLFGIALSLVNARGGLLLIDEFENGLHHTAQLDTWRTIFRIAKNLDVQVFAISHSWDAVESFQQAAAEDPEEGVLIRLSRRDEDIIPTLFREDELAIVTRDKIEVR